jgi:hypothetical protein
MANLKKKEKLYSAMYYLSTAFATYYLELIDLQKREEEFCPELQRLERAIKDVIDTTGINSMNPRQKIKIIQDHENLKKLVDQFMRI